MSKKVYVFSTLSAPVDYHIFGQRAEGMPAHKEHTISIKGGAGVANRNLITPQGVVTEITEEDAALLEEHPVFKIHKHNGYVQISRSNPDIEKAVADMDRNDPSRPLTPADYSEESGAGVTAVSNSLDKPAEQEAGKQGGKRGGSGGRR